MCAYKAEACWYMCIRWPAVQQKSTCLPRWWCTHWISQRGTAMFCCFHTRQWDPVHHTVPRKNVQRGSAKSQQNSLGKFSLRNRSLPWNCTFSRLVVVIDEGFAAVYARWLRLVRNGRRGHKKDGRWSKESFWKCCCKLASSKVKEGYPAHTMSGMSSRAALSYNRSVINSTKSMESNWIFP